MAATAVELAPSVVITADKLTWSYWLTVRRQDLGGLNAISWSAMFEAGDRWVWMSCAQRPYGRLTTAAAGPRTYHSESSAPPRRRAPRGTTATRQPSLLVSEWECRERSSAVSHAVPAGNAPEPGSLSWSGCWLPGSS